MKMPDRIALWQKLLYVPVQTYGSELMRQQWAHRWDDVIGVQLRHAEFDGYLRNRN